TNGLHLDQVRDHGLDPAKNDNRILAAALGLTGECDVVVVSADAALRIKAAQLGLKAAEHARGVRVDDDAQRGWHTIDVTDPMAIEALYTDGVAHLDDFGVAGLDVAVNE